MQSTTRQPLHTNCTLLATHASPARCPPPPHPHPHTHTPCPLPPLQYLFRGGDAFYGLRRDSSGRFVLVRYDYSGRVEVNYG